MTRRFSARAIFAAIAFFVSMVAAGGAHAANDKLWNKIASVASAIGVPHDAIELTRFSVYYPEDAGIVFARAAAEDYPFFGLVGAAKVMKGRNIPGVGLFDKNACRTPIRFVNGVFDQAGSRVSQGQSQTNTATNAAKTYAASYAQAANEQARQEAINQLNENVPYFGDINTICNFAFETNLNADRDIQKVVSDTAKRLSNAYNHLEDGDVIAGVQDLLALGASTTVACDLIDGAVADSIIGKTPLLGDLAKGACKGFVGKIIDGVGGVIKDAGTYAYNAGKTVICAVYDLFGDGCSSSPPPPTAMSEAGGYCNGRGGIESLISRTGAPNDYSVRCNDTSMCRVSPARKECATAAEIAASRLRARQENDLIFVTHLPQWQADFDRRWIDKCEDENCRIGLRLVRTNAVLAMRNKHAADPNYPYSFGYLDYFMPADRQASIVVNESIARSAQLNKNITAAAAPGWAQLAIGAWTPRCGDPFCATEINTLANAMAQRAITLQAQQPNSSALNIQGQAGREYGPQFKKAVDNSVLRQNPNLPPRQRLAAMNCTHFLGRDNDWLCSGPYPAYDICVDYAKRWLVNGCIAPNRPRFEKPPVQLVLYPTTPTVTLNPIGLGRGGAATPAPAQPGGRPAPVTPAPAQPKATTPAPAQPGGRPAPIVR